MWWRIIFFSLSFGSSELNIIKWFRSFRYVTFTVLFFLSFKISFFNDYSLLSFFYSNIPSSIPIFLHLSNVHLFLSLFFLPSPSSNPPFFSPLPPSLLVFSRLSQASHSLVSPLLWQEPIGATNWIWRLKPQPQGRPCSYAPARPVPTALNGPPTLPHWSLVTAALKGENNFKNTVTDGAHNTVRWMTFSFYTHLHLCTPIACMDCVYGEIAWADIAFMVVLEFLELNWLIGKLYCIVTHSVSPGVEAENCDYDVGLLPLRWCFIKQY